MRSHRVSIAPMKLLACFLLLALLGLSSACMRSKVVDSFPEEYVGIGVELTMKSDMPVITRVLPTAQPSKPDS